MYKKAKLSNKAMAVSVNTIDPLQPTEKPSKKRSLAEAREVWAKRLGYIQGGHPSDYELIPGDLEAQNEALKEVFPKVDESAIL